MSHRFMKTTILALTAVTFLTPAAANAAGFYIQEQSVKGLGSAFSGSTTSIDDASTIYFNPAGMTKLDGAQVNAGVHLLIPDSQIDDTGSTFLGAPVGGGPGGNPYDPTPVPNLYAAMPLTADNSVWAGIGVNAPFGLASDYGEGWFGRFDSTKTELTTINIQPSVAYKASNWLSIGGGVDIQYADAELKSAVSDTLAEGESTLKGDDWTVGYNVGLLIKPIESTEFGLHYRSAISHKLDGRISVEGLTGVVPGAPNFSTGGTADLDLPDIATFGVSHQATDKLRLMAQATWFGWNNFQDITAISDAGTTLTSVEQDYNNTMAFAIGAEYDINDVWTVRGGYQFDETPTTDEFRTSRTPDGDRNWFSAGATYNFAPNMSFDMAATYIAVDDGTIDVSRNNGLAQVTADTEGSVGIVAVGLNYKF